MRRHTLLFLLLAIGLSACGGGVSPSGLGTTAPPRTQTRLLIPIPHQMVVTAGTIQQRIPAIR